MGADDDPVYGSDDVKNEDRQYGGPENGGDEKRNIGGATDENAEESDKESLGQERDRSRVITLVQGALGRTGRRE